MVLFITPEKSIWSRAASEAGISRGKVKVVLWDLSSCEILDASWAASDEQGFRLVQEGLVSYVRHLELRCGHDGF